MDFSDGYRLSYMLEDALKLGFGTETTTGASFTLEETPASRPPARFGAAAARRHGCAGRFFHSLKLKIVPFFTL